MGRTITSLLVSGMLAASLIAQAQTETLSASAELDGRIAGSVATAASHNSFNPQSLQGGLRLKVLPKAIIKPERKVSPILRNRPVKAAESRQAGDIGGYYVGTYQTLVSASYDGGSTMQLTPDADGDSITINNFWNGCNVRAHYDKVTSTVSIPSQYVMTDESLGRLDIAVTQTDGTPAYDRQIGRAHV